LSEEKVKILVEFLKSLDERLKRLEEIAERENILIEEKIPDSGLGGKELFKSGKGISRIIKLPFCDICGKELKEDFYLCRCNKKVCSDCVIKYENRVYCLECFESLLPISRKTYKVLLAIRNEITGNRKIRKISKMGKEEIKKSILELSELGFVRKEGLLRRLRITDDGLIALDMCEQIYGNDADVLFLKSEIEREKS